MIIIHAALCRRSSSDLVKAMSMPSHHATAAYVILGIITRLYSHSAILGKSPHFLSMNALHDYKALSPFLICALTCGFYVSLSSRMTPGYLTSFVRFSFTPRYSSLTTPSVFLFLVKSNVTVYRSQKWFCFCYFFLFRDLYIVYFYWLYSQLLPVNSFLIGLACRQHSSVVGQCGHFVAG